MCFRLAHTVDSSHLALACVGGCEVGAQSETSPDATGFGPVGGPAISVIGCTARIFGGVDVPGQPTDDDQGNV